MIRVRRRFGWLFYATALVAVVSLASMPFWRVAIEQWQAWTLSGRLRDASPRVRSEAASGLAQLGAAATPWVVRAMRDPDVKVRLSACSILLRTDPDRSTATLDALIAALKDGDASVRWVVVHQLSLASGVLGDKAGDKARSRVIGALRAALEDQAKDVRSYTAHTLGTFGVSAKSAVDDLHRALADSDPEVRLRAAQALLQIDPSGSRSRVIVALIAMLDDPTARRELWQVIWILKKETGEDGVAAALIPLLKHKDMGVRHEAISFLSVSCPDARATRPTLLDALGSDDGGFRCEAAFFFLKHDPGMASRAIDVLVRQLVDPADGSYTPWDLIKKLREASPDSVGRLVSGLIEPLSRVDAPAEQRLNVIIALGVIGLPEAMPAIPSLQKAVSSGDRIIASWAAEALAKIDPKSAALHLPLLLDWIKPGEDVFVRLRAMSTLGDLGRAAKSAVPALLEASNEEEIRVSTAAIAALSRIEPVKVIGLKRSIRRGD